MSEQKYYVRLKQEAYIDNTDILGNANYYEDHIWLDVDFYFVIKRERDSFTKTELAEIMDGAFYHGSDDKCDYCRYSSDTCGDEHCEEWINPLIELVPVEEVEK